MVQNGWLDGFQARYIAPVTVNHWDFRGGLLEQIETEKAVLLDRVVKQPPGDSKWPFWDG